MAGERDADLFSLTGMYGGGAELCPERSGLDNRKQFLTTRVVDDFTCNRLPKEVVKCPESVSETYSISFLSLTSTRKSFPSQPSCIETNSLHICIVVLHTAVLLKKDKRK